MYKHAGCFQYLCVQTVLQWIIFWSIQIQTKELDNVRPYVRWAHPHRSPSLLTHLLSDSTWSRLTLPWLSDSTWSDSHCRWDASELPASSATGSPSSQQWSLTCHSRVGAYISGCSFPSQLSWPYFHLWGDTSSSLSPIFSSQLAISEMIKICLEIGYSSRTLIFPKGSVIWELFFGFPIQGFWMSTGLFKLELHNRGH